jgi:DNA-binding NarL/FixJ family response regulator
MHNQRAEVLRLLPVLFGGTMPAPSFLIVDDHPLFLEALQSALEIGFPGAGVEVANSISGARAKIDEKDFNLILLDLKMPDATGFEGVDQIRSVCPKTPLAVISAMASVEIVGKVKFAGADGFINKSQPRKEILLSVEHLLAGERWFPDSAVDAAKPDAAGNIVERLRQLTPQQLKVLTKVCEAKLNKQIAFELNVTETTIKAHITLIFKKLRVHSRTQAVLMMQRQRAELEDSEFADQLTARA